jgi:outer membrane lipoprotein-sorting protein
MPKEVEVAMKTTSAELPNAADLMDHYVDSTGGSKAYATVKTQIVKAGMTFVRQGMKADLEAKIGEGGKSYVSLDLPGAGKFELGSNGTTSWQKNVMQGPQLSTQNPSKGIFGPTAEEVSRWKQTFDKIETISKQDVNGSPCYLVKMTLKNRKEESSACFDASSGFLVKLTTLTEVQGNKIPVDMVMSDYRAEGPLKMAHHLETLMAGQPITIELTEVVINPPLPESTFALPPDVQALVDQAKKDAAAHPKNAPQ